MCSYTHHIGCDENSSKNKPESDVCFVSVDGGFELGSCGVIYIYKGIHPSVKIGADSDTRRSISSTFSRKEKNFRLLPYMKGECDCKYRTALWKSKWMWLLRL